MADLSSIFNASDPVYHIGLGLVATANPYTQVYGVTPYPGANATVPTPCISLGALGNTIFGVQIHHTYSIGDIVLYLYQLNYASHDLTSIGYIIGNAPLNTIAVQKVEDLVQASQWDGDNLTYREFPLFSNIETTAQLTAGRLMSGHGASDMLPGDVEAAGRLVSLMLGDYFAGFRGNCAEVLVSGLDRRIIQRSFLRTESAVNSVRDIAILNRSTITTEKSCGNVDDAWYSCLQEDETDISAVSEDAEPTYREITQSGDILYGKHRTILSEDSEKPLYTEYEGLDGTKTIYAATRLSIGRCPGLSATQYIGPRLNSEKQSDYTPTPELLGDPLSELDTSDQDNWLVSEDAALFALNGYPESFLALDKGEYEEGKSVELSDSLMPGEKIEIKPGKATIDWLDDGGIRLTDAWGSYILLSHGNIELHAMNNLFMVSARDTIELAGANRTLYAEQDTSIQASRGDLRHIAGNNLRLQSGDKEPTGETVIESKNILQLMADNIRVDGLYVGVTCRDPYTNNKGTAGVFQVLAGTGNVRIYGDDIKIDSNKLSLTGENTALRLASDLTAAGTLTIAGGIYSTKKTVKLPVMDKDGQMTTKKFTNTGSLDIISDAGGLHVKGPILGDNLLWVTNQVVGGEICALQKQDKVQPISAADAVRRTCARFSDAKIPEPQITDFENDSTEELEWRNTSKLSFTFGTPSKGCRYRLTTTMPEGNKANTVNDGYVANDGEKQYIYPGKAFWETSGVYDTVKNTEYGFNKVPKAKPNNG